MTSDPIRARGHYSYDHYRHEQVAREFEDDRFGGPVGEWLARGHHELVLDMLGNLEGISVLDVGGGTGRLAVALSAAGARVRVSDASSAMLRAGRERGRVGLPMVRGDIHHLPFRDRSFDTLVCSRVLMHVVDWRRALLELCRIARRRVLVDFPPASAAAVLAPVILPLKKLLEPDTQVYRVLRTRRVVEVLRKQGFRTLRIERQLALPFFLHRRLRRPELSARAERRLARLGITRRIGAPVLLLAGREDRA